MSSAIAPPPLDYDPEPALVYDELDPHWMVLTVKLPDGTTENVADIHLRCNTRAAVQVPGPAGTSIRLCKECLYRQAREAERA